MKGKKEKRQGAHTPQETEQALSALSEKLNEMEKADGVFGEELQDEDLDLVAGGGRRLTVKPKYTYFYCVQCGKRVDCASDYHGPQFCSQACIDQHNHKIEYTPTPDTKRGKLIPFPPLDQGE